MKQNTGNDGKLCKPYYGIDLMKFVMAVLVVATHTGLLKSTESLYYKIYEIILYLTVPFFFISTGYLLSEKCESCKKNAIPVLTRHTRKLIKLYIIWSVVYLPLALYAYGKGDHSIMHYLLDYIRGFFIVGEHYNSYVLWYLLSSIYSLMFIIALRKRGKSNKLILFIGCLIGTFGCILTLYAENVFELSGTFTKNLFELLIKIFVDGRIFTGFFYIPLGMCLQGSRKLSLSGGVLLFLGGLFIEIKSPGIGFVYEAGRAVASIGVFSFALNLEFKESAVYAKLRTMSTTIYFVHLWIWTIVYTLVYHEKTRGVVPFLLTIIFSLAAGYLQPSLKKS